MKPLRDDIHKIFRKTFDIIGNFFHDWKACTYRKYNQREIAEAVFDHNKRERLFKEGLPEETNGNSWIFQAKPDYYDLEGSLKSLKEQSWLIKQYKDKIHVGDIVYIWQSGPKAGIYAVAEVLSEPEKLPYAPSEEPFVKAPERFEGKQLRSKLSIKYVLPKPVSKSTIMKEPGLSKLTILTAPQGTNFIVSPDQSILLEKLINLPEVLNIPRIQPIYTYDEFEKDTGFSISTIKSWVNNLQRKKQIIFQDPPGTGKIFIAERLARLLISETEGFWDLVQFHPSYSYEDFIQGIRPKIVEGGITYELVAGRLLDFCQKVKEQANDSPCVLIIDEINRANLSRVFGELMYLLEYRDKEIALSSGGPPFCFLPNVYIIGTMNTADRSIALVDHAFRRGWGLRHTRGAVSTETNLSPRTIEAKGAQLPWELHHSGAW